MTGLSETTMGKIVCASIGVAVEIVAQIVYYYGRKFLRTPDGLHIFGAFVLFAVYLVYILIFSVCSAITFFASTTEFYQQENSRKIYNIELTKTKLSQVNQRIEALNRYLEKESETGYGTRSKDVMYKLSELTNEQDRLTRRLQNTALSKNNLEKDRFGFLGMVLGMPGNRIMIFVFGVAVFMLYVGLIITSPDSFGNVTQKVTGDIKVKSKNVTSVTQAVTNVTKCVCGCGRQPKPGRKYFDNSCKQKAYRMREAIREGL
jgi:hypothetical protein